MSKHSPKVTLQDIASAAGVSRMTVSLALRNHPKLPDATRIRIQSIADKMGYRPDPHISKLMESIRSYRAKGSGAVIAYLTSSSKKNGWRSEPTQNMYYEGAHERAAELGYKLEEFWLHEKGMLPARLSEIIRARGIDGVVVAPAPEPTRLFEGFHWEYVAAVELGYSLHGPDLYRVCNHQFHSMITLMKQMYDSGYQRVGLAMKMERDERVNHAWRAGYLAIQSMHLRKNAIPMLMTEKWTFSTFASWYKRYTPDVIVTGGNEVREWLSQLKVSVPKDVGWASVNLTDMKAGVSGIDQNSKDVGRAAVDSLIALMNANKRGIPEVPRVLMVQGSFVQGNTTRRFDAAKTTPNKPR